MKFSAKEVKFEMGQGSFAVFLAIVFLALAIFVAQDPAAAEVVKSVLGIFGK